MEVLIWKSLISVVHLPLPCLITGGYMNLNIHEILLSIFMSKYLGPSSSYVQWIASSFWGRIYENLHKLLKNHPAERCSPLWSEKSVNCAYVNILYIPVTFKGPRRQQSISWLMLLIYLVPAVIPIRCPQNISSYGVCLQDWLSKFWWPLIIFPTPCP